MITLVIGLLFIVIAFIAVNRYITESMVRLILNIVLVIITIWVILHIFGMGIGRFDLK